ncbi:MAG: class I SAM-dependent methyltransferase [Xanthobacteraceae bacterium]
MPEQSYLFDNAWGQGRARLDAVEALLDPGTIRALEGLGVAAGWRCLELGAGGGSIAAWLSRRVGCSGKIVATDLDTRYLAERAAASNVEVRRHDIVADPLNEHEFDLVHARLVLEHIPERDLVLSKLVRSLRPGGWLLLEAVDYISGVPVSGLGAGEHARSQSVRLREFEAVGMRADYGRHLPQLMRKAGLVEVGNEGRVFVMEGGSSGARWFQLSMEQLRSRLVAPDKLTDAEVDRMLELFANPGWAALSPIIFACWGRATGPQAG